MSPRELRCTATCVVGVSEKVFVLDMIRDVCVIVVILGAHVDVLHASLLYMVAGCASNSIAGSGKKFMKSEWLLIAVVAGCVYTYTALLVVR